MRQKFRRFNWLAAFAAAMLIALNLAPIAAYAKPITPGTPISPGKPISPGESIQAGDPISPGTPISPGDPIRSGDSIQPGDPIQSGDPIQPGDSVTPGESAEGNGSNSSNGQGGSSNGDGSSSPGDGPNGSGGEGPIGSSPYTDPTGNVELGYDWQEPAAPEESNSPYLSDSRLDEPTYYVGKVGAVVGKYQLGKYAYNNGQRLYGIYDSKTGTWKSVVWGKNKGSNPAVTKLLEVGRNGYKEKTGEKTLGVLSKKKKKRVLPLKNHYNSFGPSLKYSLSKGSTYGIGAATSIYYAAKQHDDLTSTDFASTAVTETAFSVGSSALGAAFGSAVAGAVGGSAVPIVGTVVGAVGGIVIGGLLETKTGRKIKDAVRTGVKKGMDFAVDKAKGAWKSVKGWFS